MRLRKAGRRLALGAVLLGMLSGMPVAHAGGSGTINDAQGDVVDFVKHSQNSFRPSTSPYPSPYTSYQKACQSGSGTTVLGLTDCSKLDLKNSSASTNATNQTITFTLQTVGDIPDFGSSPAVLPTPFSGINYAWYFATSTQESPHAIGIECTGGATTANEIKDDFSLGGSGGVPKVGAEIHYSPNTTCPAGNTPQDEASETFRTNRNALSKTNVMSVAHPANDGWLAFVEVAMAVSADGADRLDGSGKLQCKIDPTTGQRFPVCIDYELSIGSYEGYSGVSSSNSYLDFSPATRSATNFNISNNQITATIPWNPTTISTDGDLYLDDARSFPWKLAIPGQGTQMTRLTAEITGLVSVGVNSVPQVNSLCPDSTDNPVPDAQSPIKEAGAAFGSANRQVANATNQVLDQAGVGETGQDDGIYVWGNGGAEQGDCIRGITGLLTFLDWTDNGAELRIYPRNPGYLPGTTSYQCRYPIGEHPLAVVLVANATLDPMEAPSVDVNTSPFNRPYQVRVFAGSNTPATTQAGPVIGDPSGPISPLAGTVGRDSSCGYIYHAPGIHYFDIFSDFTM